MGANTREFANFVNDGLHWKKLAHYDQAGNTATSFQFNSGLYQSGYDFYRIVGRIGGSQASGNATIQVRWVNSGGSTVNSGYYSGNFTHHSSAADSTGAGSNVGQGYVVVYSPSTASMMMDAIYVPEDGHMYGFCRYHNQSTQLGVSVFSVRNNTSYAYGLQFSNSAGNNITPIDFTTYGANISGSLGGLS